MNILLNTLKNENKFCYLMGDFNINLLNYDRHNGTNDLVDLLHSYSFISLINKPTRIVGDSATLIDNIFTNCYFDQRNTFQCIKKIYITDHFPVIHVDFLQIISKIETYKVRGNLSQSNKNAFLCSITPVNWYPLLNDTDMQSTLGMFPSKLLELFKGSDIDITVVNPGCPRD